MRWSAAWCWRMGLRLRRSLLPTQIRGNTYSTNLLEQRPDASLFDVIEDIERRIIADRLERCNWNQTEAAEFFRIPLSTLEPEDQAVEHRGQETRSGLILGPPPPLPTLFCRKVRSNKELGLHLSLLPSRSNGKSVAGPRRIMPSMESYLSSAGGFFLELCCWQ